MSPVGWDKTAEVLDQRLARDPSGLIFRSFADMTERQLDWMWAGRIPQGRLTILEGLPEKGKSTVSRDLVARLTSGRGMPLEGDGERAPGNALWLTTEEHAESEILPALRVNGADLARVEEIQFNPERPESLLTFPSKAAVFERAIRERQMRGNPVSLLVVDGLTALLDRKLSAHIDQDVRLAIGVLSQVLARLNLTCIAIRHPSKSGQGPAIYRGGGSSAFSGIARSVWVVGEDPDDSRKRIMAPVKSSLAVRPRSLRFEIVRRDSSAGIEWIDECDVTADQVYGSTDARKEKRAGIANVASAAAAIEHAFARHEAMGECAVADDEIKREVVDGEVSAAAYFEAKRVLKGSQKFRSAKTDGVWFLERWRSQGGRVRKDVDD